MIGDTPQPPWPTFSQSAGPYAINSIYDVAPSFLGDLAAYFTMNPFPIPIGQVTGFKTQPGVLVDSGELPAGQSTVQLDNIDGGFFGIAVRYMCKSDAAQFTARLTLRFNNDSNTYYSSTLATRQATNATWVDVYSANAITEAHVSQVPAASSPPQTTGAGVIEIPGYSSKSYMKSCMARGTEQTNPSTANGILDVLGAGHYLSTNPITSITVGLNAGNFTVNSRFAVYGF